MKKLTVFLVFLLLAIIIFGVWYRWSDIMFFAKFNKEKSARFEIKTDFQNIVSVIEKQLQSPEPLKIIKPKTGVQADLTGFKIIQETNLQREENGLPALKENELLNAAALAKANDMFLNQYFEHNSPLGVDPGKLVQNYGYKYIVAGENLIMGNDFSSAKEVVKEWMNSPGHRANILNNRYSEIGVSIIKGVFKGETVWMGVQEFGLPMANCKEPNVVLKDEIDQKKIELDSFYLQINTAKEQINATKNNAQYNILVDQYNELVRQYQILAEDIKNLVAQYNNQVNSFNACAKGE